MAGVRLQKLIAQAGIASRRGAERLIRAGRVRVNGHPIWDPATQADPERDRISVDGQEIRSTQPKRYVLLHKPAGYLTTREDPRGRPRVFDLLPDLGVRLHPVGRLDYDAEGLLLLTNDGALTYRLTHPRHAVPRTYHVCVEGRADPATLGALRRGVLLEDGPARAEDVRWIREAGAGKAWLALTLREGRYREVKRLCRAVGLGVCRLVRVALGPLRLGRLAPGRWRELTRREAAALGCGEAVTPRPGRPC
ncbi:MAG: rRNA pseudouridine synthase [Candidatus Rokubacteria bacterium]|nr:rRNA pseudouridine synthase [Candidatus Rokubacteria bacterium]